MSSPVNVIEVSDQATLNAAIEQLDQTTTPGNYQIQFTGNITEGESGQPDGIYAISLHSGVTLTIEGGNFSLNGAGSDGGLAVISGNVTIQNLTITDTLAQGGAGTGDGGGGAGLGGGLFVGPTANVTLDNVSFSEDAAKGGDGGTGGFAGAGGNSSLLLPAGNDGGAGAAGTAGAPGTPNYIPATDGGPGGTGNDGLDGKSGGLGGKGGDGGDGGDGGAGGLGGSGTQGHTVGADGGDGGDAGKGGAGGKGGTVGVGGSGGGGGNGGTGGTGGPGYGARSGTGGAGGDGADGGGGGNGEKAGDGGFGGGGGAGGNGGTGGKGGAGGDGGYGGRTSISVFGSYSGSAGPGGDGGNGKDGGNGGDGADGGAGGFGAGGGGGGEGGAGGSGGNGGDGGVGGGQYYTNPYVAGHSNPWTPTTPGQAGGDGGDGGDGADGGKGGNGGSGGFGGGGGGGGAGGAAGIHGVGGSGGTGGQVVVSNDSGVGYSGPHGTAGNAGNDGQDGNDGDSGDGAAGGFGAGGGAPGSKGGAGGGGLGAGGDIFVAQGGTLTIDGGTLADGSVAGGSGANDGNPGPYNYGTGIFLQGNETITVSATSGQPLTISGVIADQTSAGATGANAGAGHLDIGGTGTVKLAAENTFVGGIDIESGILDLAAPDAAGLGPIKFDPGTLEFTPADAPSNQIENFGAGDKIVINGFQETGDSYSGGHLVLDGPGGPVSLDLPGFTSTAQFSIVDDTNTDTTTITQACYCRGTLIQTRTGQRLVEELQIGDEVMTASGRRRPIKWVGRRSYAGRFIVGRKDVLPVCIKPGALDDNVPARDLWISPNHAMYFDSADGGVLVEAKDLINGVSIARAERIEHVEYFHIELETHDVIVAEGALSETFIDDDSRSLFHNAHEYRRIYAEEQVAPTHYCAPRVDEGYELETIRQRIAQRAGLSAGNEATPGALRGFVDRVTPHLVEGWAQNADLPEVPVCLDILARGTLVGQVLANRYREDLKHAGLGSGCHSFAFRLPPELASARNVIEVRRSLDEAVLPLSTQVTGFSELGAA